MYTDKDNLQRLKQIKQNAKQSINNMLPFQFRIYTCKCVYVCMDVSRKIDWCLCKQKMAVEDVRNWFSRQRKRRIEETHLYCVLECVLNLQNVFVFFK